MFQYGVVKYDIVWDGCMYMTWSVMFAWYVIVLYDLPWPDPACQPGACAINGTSIEFSMCADLKIGLTDHSAILHTSREYYCRDICTIRVLHIFLEFRIPSKYLSLVARAHGLPWDCMVWYVYSCYAYIWHALPPNRLKCLLVSPDDQWKWHMAYYLCRFGVDEWYEIQI